MASRFLVVALMFLFSVMNYFNRTIMSIAGPDVMKEFSLSPTQMGIVYSAFLLAYALFMMPGGMLVDRIGARRTLTLVGFSTALFTGLTAVGGILPVLVGIRFLMGMCTSPLYPACG